MLTPDERRLTIATTALERIVRASLRSGDQIANMATLAADALADIRGPDYRPIVKSRLTEREPA